MPERLFNIALYLLCPLPMLSEQAGQPPEQQPSPRQEQAPEQKKSNLFETVAPPPPPEPPKPGTEDIIEIVNFRGARRVPQETLRALIYTKKGDKYDQESVHRDFMALWNTGRFNEIRVEREPGKTGWVVTFVVIERRVIRSIKYEGMKSITVSEILDRLKDRRVGLSVESQYDPNKIQRARNVLQEYLAERGRQFATVEPEIHQVPPSSLEVVFNVNEGPKVKVGEIEFEGDNAFKERQIKRAMKNLHPIGVPYSISSRTCSRRLTIPPSLKRISSVFSSSTRTEDTLPRAPPALELISSTRTAAASVYH